MIVYLIYAIVLWHLGKEIKKDVTARMIGLIEGLVYVAGAVLLIIGSVMYVNG